MHKKWPSFDEYQIDNLKSEYPRRCRKILSDPDHRFSDEQQSKTKELRREVTSICHQYSM